ncbi:hypothetical protein KY320_00665 [Candidatus Woesearchaeota archaeon]|nr:hypothetical protein [Candidatus Woesearchaeota archaeon]
MKICHIAVMLLVIGLAACNPHGPTGGTVTERCGFLDEPCCKGELYQDEWGMIRQDTWCEGDLSCRAEICVEGPEFQAYDRNSGW